ncbi:LruC domain-containing protein [Parabacteroides sp. OttesenSCG-928-G07]|nr:LruC domain-containing protein [Parabacteroides sp. OttesenSCG-928-G07]
MKKLVFLFTLALSMSFFFSCEKSDIYNPSGDGDEKLEEAKDILKAYSLTNQYDVVVKEGYNTLVMIGEDTVYYGNLPALVDIPKTVETKSSNVMEVLYVPKTDDINFGYISQWGMLLFEDVPQGDCDYNDLVVEFTATVGSRKDTWVNGKPNPGNLYHLQFDGYVTAVAKGGGLPLQFGFEIREIESGTVVYEKILTGNVGNDFFPGTTGFINTYKDFPFVLGEKLNFRDTEILKEINGSIGYNWFIVVNGQRYYTSGAYSFLKDKSGLKYDELILTNGRPTGLLVPNVNRNILIPGTKNFFRWPIENQAIWNAYPQFNNWVDGKTNNPFAEQELDLLYGNNVNLH